MDTAAFTAKRRRLGWSLRDVERETGIAFSTLSRFERGERIGARVSAGIATWISDPDPKRRVEVAFTRDGRYLVGYSNETEAGGFTLLGDITDQLANLAAAPKQAEQQGVGAMPPCDNREPHGVGDYLESDKDWCRRNPSAVTWLIDNHASIRAALNAPTGAVEKERET